jgi:hypothetical protein
MSLTAGQYLRSSNSCQCFRMPQRRVEDTKVNLHAFLTQNSRSDIRIFITTEGAADSHCMGLRTDTNMAPLPGIELQSIAQPHIQLCSAMSPVQKCSPLGKLSRSVMLTILQPRKHRPSHPHVTFPPPVYFPTFPSSSEPVLVLIAT